MWVYDDKVKMALVVLGPHGINSNLLNCLVMRWGGDDAWNTSPKIEYWDVPHNQWYFPWTRVV